MILTTEICISDGDCTPDEMRAEFARLLGEISKHVTEKGMGTQEHFDFDTGHAWWVEAKFNYDHKITKAGST